MLETPEAPPPRKFRSDFTILCGAILLFGFGFLLLTSALVSPIHGIRSPERALGLIASRTMEFRQALRGAPGWERTFYRFWDPVLGSDREAQELVDWYHELARVGQDTTAAANALILKAEAGGPSTELGTGLEEVRGQTERWRANSPGNLPLLSYLVQQAYLQQDRPEEPQTLLGLVRELLPPGWFRNRLEQRIAEKAHLQDPVPETERAENERGLRLLWRYRFLTLLELAFLFLCGACALLLLARRDIGWRVGPASLPPRWDWTSGVTVLIRGLAMGTLLGLAFVLTADLPDWVSAVLTYLLWTLPLLFLARRHLFSPQGLRLWQELGLCPSANTWKKLFVLTLVACGADELGSWLIFLIGDRFQWSYHWAESFEENLIWGSLLTTGATVVSLAVIAPFFEELVFRGFLYGTLRKRMRWLPAALITAFLFSLAHGYGLLGFATILWSGLVLAWVYERSGSLVPAVAVHTLGNFLFAVTQIAMLRLR